MSQFTAKDFRILLAEDDVTFQKILVSFLSRLGYEVISVATAKDFWYQFEQQSPDLVLLDIMLPDGNGFSLVHRIRMVDEILPVVIVSSLYDASDRELGLASGADVFLTKPACLNELAAVVKRAIVRQIAIQQRYESILSSSDRIVSSGASWLLTEQSKCLTSPKGIILPLNLMEFNFLHLLATTNDSVSRELLSDQLGKSSDIAANDSALNTLVCRLKKRWRDMTHQDLPVRSLRKKGYLFAESIEVIST
jgi:two-component system OmpR family response regulator